MSRYVALQVVLSRKRLCTTLELAFVSPDPFMSINMMLEIAFGVKGLVAVIVRTLVGTDSDMAIMVFVNSRLTIVFELASFVRTRDLYMRHSFSLATNLRYKSFFS